VGYRKVLSRHPDRLNALTGLGRLLLHERRYEEAVGVWQKAVAIEPDAGALVFQLSRALHRSRQLERAAEQYLRVVALDPTHEKAFAALEELGARLARVGRLAQDGGTDTAAEIGKRLLALWPDLERARDVAAAIARTISAAASTLVSQAPDTALARFNAAFALAPDLPEALRGAAECFERLGQPEKALAVLDRQIRANPRAIEPQLQRERILAVLEGHSFHRTDGPAPKMVRALEPQGREAMLAHARRLVAAGDASFVERPAAETGLIERLLQRARSAYNEGKLEEAETLLGQLLIRDELNLGALSTLSRLYMRQRRWADAIGILKRLHTLQPSSAETKKMLARALLEDGQFEATARIYIELSVLEPENPDVWKSLGQINKRLQNWVAARGAWVRLTEINPDRPELRLELASACYQAGDGDAAQAELQWILAGEPDHRGALALLGRVRLATDPEGSLACWSRLAALNPAAIEPKLQIARIHLRRRRMEEAEAGFRAVIDRDPAHNEALVSLGRILGQRNPEEAVRLFARWSEQDPTAIAPWLAAGRLHAGAKRLELAETAFRRALDLAPANVEALTGLGRLCSVGGRLDEAMGLWSQLAELGPDAVEPKLQIARILYTRRDPNTVEALRSVLKFDPQHREALQRLAQLLGRDRATDFALEIWDQLADLDPGAVSPIVQRGRLLERVRRFAEAETEFRRAVTRDPRHPMALAGLAEFYRNRQRWDEAIAVYRAHLLVEPERIDVILGLGQCLDRLNRLLEAVELYERVLALAPDNITALGYRGRLLRTLGQVDGAIADFRRICALEPGNAGAWHELIFYLAGAEREAEALAALENAEAALGETPEAWIKLALAAAAALFDGRAVVFFERAIAAQPENPTYHGQFGLYYFRQGVLDGAFHHLLDSRELEPGNIEVARGLFDTTRGLRALGFDHVAMRHGPRTVGEILIPERLFARVREIAATVTPYEPVPRRIIAISASLAPGGAERQLVNMLRGLSNPAFGLDLALLCISLSPRSRRDFFLPILEGTGVDIVVPDPDATEDAPWAPEVAPFAELIGHFPADMAGSIAFWLQEFRRRRPQVVHAWQDSTNLTAVVAALLAGVPRIILCCRSVHPDNPRRRLRRFMKEAYQAVLDHPAVVLSNNSRAGANDYAEWLGIEPGRVEVVYNGVDFDRLDSTADPAETARLRQELGIPPGAPVLGGVYRVSEEKRPLLWLDVAAAVARHHEAVHFVVCGDGPMRDEMGKYAATLGIGDRVHLPGAQSNIGSWFKMMDVVMLTSRHEGLPNVLLEAQSMGIPVVAPDVGGISEVVEQGVTGWTVRDADAGSLAERVLHCMSNRAWRQPATERAPVFVRERFGIATMLRRNLEVYGIPPDAMAMDDR